MEKWVIPNFVEGRYSDSLWINFQAKEFISQSGFARGEYAIKSGRDILGEWKLLAPKNIAESIAHDWGEYESIGSRIAQKIGDFKKVNTEIQSGLKAYNNVKNKLQGNESLSARSLLSTVAGSLARAEVPKYKIDTSVVYQDSKRREYSLTFNFAITHINNDTKKDVFDPIRKMEELSCAQATETLVDIKFPAIFKIWTSPGDIIKINYAVITSVQPTWSAPYVKGYPTNCELQITFMDLEPLYRRSFRGGGVVRTSRDVTSKTGGRGGL